MKCDSATFVIKNDAHGSVSEMQAIPLIGTEMDGDGGCSVSACAIVSHKEEPQFCKDTILCGFKPSIIVSSSMTIIKEKEEPSITAIPGQDFKLTC